MNITFNEYLSRKPSIKIKNTEIALISRGPYVASGKNKFIFEDLNGTDSSIWVSKTAAQQRPIHIFDFQVKAILTQLVAMPMGTLPRNAKKFIEKAYEKAKLPPFPGYLTTENYAYIIALDFVRLFQEKNNDNEIS